jgi:NitT/TauT family transport system ATP-binding protein
MDNIVDIKNLNLTYHSLDSETTALENINLEIKQHEFISIVGPSGCGKTTVLNIASGILKPDSGDIKSDGKIAYMFQEPRLIPAFNVRDNILAVLKGKNKNAIGDKYISLVELEAHVGKYPSELSGGMAQRVAFARFLAFAEETDATLLLLDEPFSSLDEEMRERMIEILLDFAKEKSVIYVTHNTVEAERISDKIIKL